MITVWHKAADCPLLNGSDAPIGILSIGTPIEGFGNVGDSWPSEIPIGLYWAGTPDTSSGRWWHVQRLFGVGDFVGGDSALDIANHRVVVVP